MAFGQLYAGHIECQVTLLTIFGFQRKAVFHCHVQSDKRTEGFGDSHIADVESRTRAGCTGCHITHETNHHVIAVSADPSGVGTEGTDGVLTGVCMRQGDGFEMVTYPRQFA